jgi:hypothetical protein
MKTSKSTGVDATPQSIELTQQDLLIELNELYVELTGNGMSEMFKNELMKHSVDTIMMLIDEKKEVMSDLLHTSFDDDDRYLFSFQEEPQRCDSIEFNDKF